MRDHDDPARDDELAVLKDVFPSVVVWFGEQTRRWWAMYGDRLIEGHTPGHIGEQLTRAHQRAHSPKDVHTTAPAPSTTVGHWRCPPGHARCQGPHDCVCRQVFGGRP